MKRLLSLFVVLVMLVSLAACADNASGTETSATTTSETSAVTSAESVEPSESAAKEFVPSGEKIKVAALINTDGLAVWYADKMGYFEELGLDVEVAYFVNGVLENEALAAGEASIGFNGFAGVYALATGDYSLIGDADDGKGLAVYVRPEVAVTSVLGEYDANSPNVYGNIDTATGLTFAVTLGTIQEIMVRAYYGHLGISDTDYTLVGMDNASAYNALISDQVDGAALTMNMVAAAEEAGMVCLGTYEDITGVGTGSEIIVPNSYLDSNYDDTVLVLRAFYKALDEIQNDEQLEFDEGLVFFEEQGAAYTEDQMWTEINTRDLYTYEAMKTLKFGNHVVYSAMNLVTLGLLEPGSSKIVADSIRADVLEDALGFPITVVIPEGYENY